MCEGCKCGFVSVQIRNLSEILSGQLRTNTMDEFVTGVKAIEQEWVSVLGRTLSPVFYRKMPLRLAKQLSAGFKDKESKPQVHIGIHFYKLAKGPLRTYTWCWYCRMKSGARLFLNACALFGTARRKD